MRVEILSGAREDLKQSPAYIKRKFGQEAVEKFSAMMRGALQTLADDYKTGAIPTSWQTSDALTFARNSSARTGLSIRKLKTRYSSISSATRDET